MWNYISFAQQCVYFPANEAQLTVTQFYKNFAPPCNNFYGMIKHAKGWLGSIKNAIIINDVSITTVKHVVLFINIPLLEKVVVLQTLDFS